MLAVTGLRSRIIEELIPLLPQGEQVVRIDEEPPVAWRYVLCAGTLNRKPLYDQSMTEITDSLHVNLVRPIQLCEAILRREGPARIVVIGSESGFAWSYDDTYAAAKAGLHRYVETRKLRPDQQLVAIAPSIIADTNMTRSRKDTANLESRRLAHPKRRFLRAVEVARLIHFLLYVDEGYLSGQVIRINGGV